MMQYKHEFYISLYMKTYHLCNKRDHNEMKYMLKTEQMQAIIKFFISSISEYNQTVLCKLRALT